MWRWIVQGNPAELWLIKTHNFFPHDNYKTNCSRRVFYGWTTAEFKFREIFMPEDFSEWKSRLQWLMWPSTQRIGKDIRASSLFFTRRAADAITEVCFIAMTGDRHNELAALDLGMIAVALIPSWLVWILTYATFAIFFIIPVLFLNTELYKQHEC